MVRLMVMLDIFDWFTIPLEEWLEPVDTFLAENRGFTKNVLAWPVDQVLDRFQDFLNFLPPSVLLGALVVIALWAAGWRVALFALLALAAVGYLDIWSEFVTTFAIVLTAVFFCVIIGIPLGILASRSDAFAAAIRPILDIMQTTPAFVYLLPVVILFSIGNTPGVIVTFIFAIPPLIRLTNLGIRQVDTEVIEAALAFGSSPREVLTKVQMPLSLPTIMAGVNQTIMLALSMVVIASLIGARGLGQLVFEGINTIDLPKGALGGVGIVLMAMVLDRVTQGLGEKGPGAHQKSSS